ncbi:MAG TPA: TonB-dependent receptor [Bryobacteraceae bacterium]|nr:TonB-dependent receptor [Bryobacteraceae bacterium]
MSSPSKEPTPAFRSPVAIYVLTGDDIRRSGVTTIPDALRLIPGVEVAQIDASKWSIGIRGFGTRLTRDVLVLIDGRTVYTELFAGTYWEVQDTLLEDIDRIEVIRGPGGTIWGPNAVDGVINIITKSSKDTQGAYMLAGGGNQEQGFLDSRYGGTTSSGLTWRVYEKTFTRGPEHHPDGDDFDDWRGIQGGFRMDWGSGRDAFTVQGDAYVQKDGEQVSYTTYTPPLTIAAQDGFEDVSGGNVLFRWKRTFSATNDFQLQVYYDRANRLEPNLGEDRDTVDADFLARTRWGSRQEISYGAGVRVAEGRFDEVDSGLVFFPFHRTDYLLSTFVQDDIDLVDGKLMFTAGTKALNTNYTHGILFQPSVRLMWTPTTKQTVWTSFTHAVRTPSDAEEAFYLSSLIGTSGAIPVFARFNANPRFSPEQLNAYELGFRQLAGKNLYIDVAGYYNHYHDLFSEDITGGYSLQNALPYPTSLAPPTYILLPAQFRNDLYGATYGAEIAPEWRPTEFWRLRGSYSYLHMSLKAAPSPGSIPLGATQDNGSSPENEVSLDSGFQISGKLDLDLVYRYVSRLPYVQQNVPAYSTGDIRVGYRLYRHIELSVAGRNLFQPFHVEYIGDPGGPVAISRSVYASLAWMAK